MHKTAEFSAFFNLYSAVMSSAILTTAEKTAAIEAAFDEYQLRSQPPHFITIARRLAAQPVSVHAQTAASSIDSPREAPGTAKRNVAPATRRGGPRVS